MRLTHLVELESVVCTQDMERIIGMFAEPLGPNFVTPGRYRTCHDAMGPYRRASSKSASLPRLKHFGKLATILVDLHQQLLEQQKTAVCVQQRAVEMTQGPSDGHANIFLGVAFFSTYKSYSYKNCIECYTVSIHCIGK